MDLTEFYAARLDEREALARRVQAVLDAGWNYFDEVPTELIDPARVLREAGAGRAIVEIHRPGFDPGDAHDADLRSIPCDTIRHLAAVYSDHPDYREEWSP